eukprot:4016103-Amphidinium_carterae.1
MFDRPVIKNGGMAKNRATSSNPDVAGQYDQAYVIALQSGMINDIPSPSSHDISHLHGVCKL